MGHDQAERPARRLVRPVSQLPHVVDGLGLQVRDLGAGAFTIRLTGTLVLDH
jgi:hypothetical protein